MRMINPRLIIFSVLVLHPMWASSQTDFWEQTNGPYGGYILSLAVNSNDHLFAGTLNSGIFRSTDDGNSWAPVNNGITNSGVTTATFWSLAVNSSGHVFAGASGFLPDLGVYRSTDNGDTWVHFSADFPDAVVSLAVNSIGVIFAGTSSAGLFMSADNGETWTEIASPFMDTGVWSIAITSEDHLIVGTGLQFYPGGVTWRSTDGGATWTNPFVTDYAVRSLAISPNGIFAGTSGRVFRSTDDGVTWESTTVFSGSWVYALALTSDGAVIAGTSDDGIFRSTDNGSSWTQVNTTTGINALVSSLTGQIFLGTFPGGIFRSTDDGLSWAQSPLIGTSVGAITSNAEGDIFAGETQGIFRSTDRGNSWSITGSLGNHFVQVLSFDINSSGHIIVGTGSGVFRSIDEGATWLQTGLGDGNIVWSLALDNSDHILAATWPSGVFLSTDNGDTWTSAGLSNPYIYSIGINSMGHIFAGSVDSGVFFSSNGGGSWSQVNNGLADSIIVLSLAINSSDDVFIGTIPFTGLGGSVYRSTDNGGNWTATFVDTSLFGVRALAFSSIGHLFAGTYYGGVYRTTDNGASWSQDNSGLTNLAVFSLTVTADDYVCVGTAWGGVFRSIYSTSDVRQLAPQEGLSFSLGQNYPNPFNPTTKIQFSIPHSGFVTLRVYDVLGQELTTLVADDLLMGGFEVQWDASDYASGVYFCRLRAGGFNQTRKLLLQK